MDSVQILEHVSKVADRVRTNSPIYKFLLSELTFQDAKPGFVKGSFELKAEHLNSRGSIHGTTSAAIFDFMGGIAIASHGLEQTGVSIDIHVTYLSGAKLGDSMEVEAVCDKLGGAMAFTSVTVYKLDGEGNRAVVSKGTHTKYVRR